MFYSTAHAHALSLSLALPFCLFVSLSLCLTASLSLSCSYEHVSLPYEFVPCVLLGWLSVPMYLCLGRMVWGAAVVHNQSHARVWCALMAGVACSNKNCPAHQTRTGACSGSTNGYKCVSFAGSCANGALIATTSRRANNHCGMPYLLCRTHSLHIAEHLQLFVVVIWAYDFPRTLWGE